jgi:hypothetical protein
MNTSKYNQSSKITDYINLIHAKCEKQIPKISRTLSKITDKIPQPSMNNYNCLFEINYSAIQLKEFAKKYKIKITGTKNELITRIYIHLKLSAGVISIQKIFRGRLVRTCARLHGPALLRRHLCTNDTDFLSGDCLKDLHASQFFSYTDVDNFIYGFDIISLYNLFLKSDSSVVKNPYNRNEIPQLVIQNILKLVRISKILKIVIEINITNDLVNITPKKTVELRTLDLFQHINSLGNYSDHTWFSLLQRSQLIKFLRELIDIWNYRAQLSESVKRAICPPIGDPFRIINIDYIMHENNIDVLRKIILDVLEKMVNNGVTNDNKSLGAYYILGALTLVNPAAALAIPWLYQSVSYH